MNLSSLNNTLQSFHKTKKYDNFIDQELLQKVPTMQQKDEIKQDMITLLALDELSNSKKPNLKNRANKLQLVVQNVVSNASPLGSR